jgi:hypothetical protein
MTPLPDDWKDRLLLVAATAVMAGVLLVANALFGTGWR